MKSLIEISHNQGDTFNFVEVKVKFTVIVTKSRSELQQMVMSVGLKKTFSSNITQDYIIYFIVEYIPVNHYLFS